ncbi:MAG: hypothetical protein IPK71_14315 [Myxococcales bacterium]|nr:hypothetical protein [Myxococcales bacterium]
MKRFSCVAAAVGPLLVFVGCTSDAAAPPIPPRPVLSAPRLAAQGAFAARLFSEEVYLFGRAKDLTAQYPRPYPEPLGTGNWPFLVRADVAWLASVAAVMDVARANVASGSLVSEREARVLGALAYRAWAETRALLDAAELRAAPVLAKLRVATPQELEVIRGALEDPSFSLESHLAAGLARRMTEIRRIETALQSAAEARREGVSAIPRAASVEAALAAAGAIGRILAESQVFGAPSPISSPYHQASTVEGLVGLGSTGTAVRFEVTTHDEATTDVVAPRYVALFASHESIEVVLPPGGGPTLVEARATLEASDPTASALSAANDALVRAAFAALREPLGSVDVGGGSSRVRLPAHLLQVSGRDLRGVNVLDAMDFGAVDIVLASDCFDAHITSYTRLPGRLPFDTSVDRCKDARCGPAVDVLLPRVRDRAACDACLVGACGLLCSATGTSVPRSAALCARCRPCDEQVSCLREPEPPSSDGFYCGKAQVGCSVPLFACQKTCERETSASEPVARCVQSACAEACAQE